MKILFKCLICSLFAVLLLRCGGRTEAGHPILKADPGAIEGYLDRISYDPGDTLTMRVHTPQPAFSYSIIRLGLAEPTLLVAEGLPGMVQAEAPGACTEGARWQDTCSCVLPADWPSGLYAVKLKTAVGHSPDDAYHMPFILKGRRGPGQPPIAVLSNTLTWQAYNAWGGGSFYKGSPEDPDDHPVPIVSLQRPNTMTRRDSRIGHTGCAEKYLQTFLRASGFHYHQLADLDLHRDPEALSGYKLLILQTHSEYWTQEMFDRLEAFVQGGGSVLDIAGNVLGWKVTLQGDRMECRKDGGLHTQTGERGGTWRDLGRPSEPLLGLGSNPKGTDTFAPFRVLDGGHWLFGVDGPKNGTLIGVRGLNNGGGSGWETDKMGPLTPPNAVLLARGTNPGGGGADIVFFETPAGGAVLAAGSISFAGSLVEDPALQVLVKNFLNAYQNGKEADRGKSRWEGTPSPGSQKTLKLDCGVKWEPSRSAGPSPLAAAPIWSACRGLAFALSSTLARPGVSRPTNRGCSWAASANPPITDERKSATPS